MSDTEKKLNRLSGRLKECLGPDRVSFRRELSRLRKQRSAATEKDDVNSRIEALAGRMASSEQRRRARVAARPKLSYPDALPISARKDEIVAAIRRYQVVIISGETGSGKTTQIPKFCLAAGRGIDGKIGCTQPRRIAAVSVSARISEELGRVPGEAVGHKIRFQDKTGPDAFIKVMTDGILLAETQRDPLLKEYDTLIVDEAHERSLNIDFLLGILHKLLGRRRDLKLVITSATIDTEKFAAAFDGAPVIEVSGRTFPVEVRWENNADNQGAEDEQTYVEKAARATARLWGESPTGDILVFMPTEQDIRDTIEILEGKKFPNTDLLPLFARLTAADQARVFSSRSRRKIIVSTNIAETSLTIPGIKFVVDTGLARVSRYNPRTRTTALPIVPISRSSADQRMGRCGRVENGICVRLFTQEEYNQRPRFTRPEVLRANLAEVILRMLSLQLGDIAAFPFLDRPAEKSIQDGFDLLMELGAIEQTGAKDGRLPFRLTERGRKMTALPLDPRLSRMLIAAKENNCTAEVAVIAAALSIQDPRERPADKSAEADRAHRRFTDPLSDFVSLLNLWRASEDTGGKEGKTGRMKKFCKTHFLSFRRMREWRDIHGQITGTLTEHRWFSERTPQPVRDLRAESAPRTPSAFSPLYMAVHQSILSGFLSNIAVKKEGNLYQACKGKQVMIFPGSGLFGKAGRWIMAAEMVETSRLYARTVAAIDPEWIEPLARERCRIILLEPHWEKNREQVVATRQVNLYGLIITTGAKVAFGPVDPDQATEIFIRSALVDGDVKRPRPFMTHNGRQIESVRDLEDKIRRRDVLVTEEDLAGFYRERLTGVYDMRTLDARIRKAGGDGWLRMQEKDLVRQAPSAGELALFPDRVTIAGVSVPCDYAFVPGEENDGITVKIPAEAATAVPAESVDWMVPGLYREKIEALIKGLPKAYRRGLTPVSRSVEIICSEMPFRQGALLPSLSRFVKSRLGVTVPLSAWKENDLPDHLKPRVAITDRKGRILAADRGTDILKTFPARSAVAGDFSAAKKRFERTGIEGWDIGALPEETIITDDAGNTWTAFPALVDNRSGAVALRLFTGKADALVHHRQGVRALAETRLARDIKYLRKALKLPAGPARLAAIVGGAAYLEESIVRAALKSLCEKNVRTQEAFEGMIETAGRSLLTTGDRVLKAAVPVLEAIHDTRRVLYDLEKNYPAAHGMHPVCEEIRRALSSLVPETFVTLYEAHRLPHLVRYVRAMGIRARKAADDPARDQRWTAALAPHLETLSALLESITPETSDARRALIEEYFWMLEEYKISIFAQEIKTDGPVSAKRLRKKVQQIEDCMV